jgi:hypothetical protein
MLSNGTPRLPPAAIAGLVLAAVLTPAAGYARGDSGVESLFDEYRPMAYAKSVLPVLPTPLCGGGELSRSPLFVAGDGNGDFGFLVQQVGDQAESLYRLARGGDCVTQLEFALPLDAALAGGGTCSLTTTQDLVAHPDPGYVLHSLSGLDDQQATCFVTFRVALATGAREPVLDSSVVAAPVVSFNASPWSTDIRQPVFTTVERMASVAADGSFDLTEILRAGDPVATETCATATVDEFRARPAVSGSRILVNADFDESSCQGGVTQGLLLVAYEAGGDSWTATGVVAREPGTGEAVVPSGTIGHPDIEMFLTNGVDQATSGARAYTLDVSPDGLTVAANPVEDLYADVGAEPDLLSIFRSFAPGRTASGRPVMLGVADCRYRGVAEASGCLLAIGPPPGSDGAQQRRRLARVVGWGRDLPGYAPGRFVEARYAETSGDNVLVNIDEYDVSREYFGRGFQQLSFDGYRPSTVVDDKLRLARALADGGMRIEQVKPLAGSPLLDGVDVGATAHGFVTAQRDGEQVLAGLREGSLVAEVYGLDGALRNAVDFSGFVDARAFFRLRDYNGNGADELGLAGFDESGQTVVTVRDGGDGQELASWTTGAEYRSGFAAVLEDLNGNGAE